MDIGRIGVLMGGPSSEREISFKSGKAVLNAFNDSGYEAVEVDIQSRDEKECMDVLNKADIDVAFIALHGEFGEDGQIQKILENMKIPYTGSGCDASMLAMNKIKTQKLLSENGVNVPGYHVVPKDFKDLAEHVDINNIKFPVVVKPSSEGSSIGITLVFNQSELNDAVCLAAQYKGDVLIEEYIKGREITVGILGGKALSIVEIKAKNRFFDFEAKYKKGTTKYVVPAEISSEVTSSIKETALKIFGIIGCRDFSRIDFILKHDGSFAALEVNTIPGFTETSLLPMAAKDVGIGFTDLCVNIVKLACNRA